MKFFKLYVFVSKRKNSICKNSMQKAEGIASRDNFNVLDACNGLDLIAIFECKAIYFGTYYFKPSELVIFTSKGLRIKANKHIKFEIPIEDVIKAKSYFTPTKSIICIRVAISFSQYMHKIVLKTETEIDEESKNDKNLIAIRNSRIVLVCENLPEGTENVLRTMFINFCDMDSKKAQQLLTTCKRSCRQATFSTDRQTLIEIKSSLSCLENVNDADLTTIQPEINDIRPILVYPKSEGSISLLLIDYMCLAKREFLNDKIIDFYLKYIQINFIKNQQTRRRTHIFSCYFYHVLTAKNRYSTLKDGSKLTEAEKRHARVSKWTKNVNIFKKDFIIVPINEESHWFLAIICFTNLALKEKLTSINLLSDSDNDDGANDVHEHIIKQPVILIFDSLSGKTNYKVVSILRDYLTCEYKAKMSTSSSSHTFTKDNMPGHRIKVPQQQNFYDCGLFLLQYVEYFFKNPIKDYRIPIKELSNWFNNTLVARKREEIAELIKQLIDEQHQQNNAIPKVMLPKISFPTLHKSFVEFDSTDSEEENGIIEISRENNVKTFSRKRKLYNSTVDYSEASIDGTDAAKKTAK